MEDASVYPSATAFIHPCPYGLQGRVTCEAVVAIRQCLS